MAVNEKLLFMNYCYTYDFGKLILRHHTFHLQIKVALDKTGNGIRDLRDTYDAAREAWKVHESTVIKNNQWWVYCRHVLVNKVVLYLAYKRPL